MTDQPYTFERKGASWRVLHGRREVWSSTDALQSMKIMQLLNAETRPVQFLHARIVELQSMEDAELDRLRSENTGLREAIDRGGLDISLCDNCGLAVVCFPDGMPLCDPCGEKLTAEAAKEADRG